MTMKTTTKSGKNQKLSREVREEKVEAIWNHKLFAEKFIFDPLSVSFKPTGAVIFRLSW